MLLESPTPLTLEGPGGVCANVVGTPLVSAMQGNWAQVRPTTLAPFVSLAFAAMPPYELARRIALILMLPLRRNPAMPHQTLMPSVRRRGRIVALIGACLTLLLPAGGCLAADKTDVIELDNGDHLTGEIKKLERGLLTLKTDALGTVEIEWPRVASLRTGQLLEIERSDGSRRHGHVVASDAPRTLLLEADAAGGQQTMSLDSVVHIVPLSEGGWRERIDAHVSVGLDAASANDDRQVTVSADIEYRDAMRSLSASYDAARTESANNPSSERQDLDALYRWFPNERRFWALTGALTRNDQLDLNLRTLVGAGSGRYWLRDPQREFWALAGLVLTRENYRNDESHQNVEGVLLGNYQFFRFDDPEVDLSATLVLYPSFTVSGRMRSELSLRARFELVKDLYYELTWLRSGDNRPPTGAARELDWSLVSSLGYKF